MTLREETFRLEAAIRVLHRTVFGRNAESDLIDLLRADGLITASVVAEEEHQVIGHALAGDIRIETQDGIVQASSLGPIAVSAGWRRQGVGTALVREVLDLATQRGKSACIVLGDPQYYTRFGFSSLLAKNLRSPYSNRGSAWMALELKAGALKNAFGLVRYPEQFTRARLT